jgi:hypothetical protein
MTLRQAQSKRRKNKYIKKLKTPAIAGVFSLTFPFINAIIILRKTKNNKMKNEESMKKKWTYVLQSLLVIASAALANALGIKGFGFMGIILVSAIVLAPWLKFYFRILIMTVSALSAASFFLEGLPIFACLMIFAGLIGVIMYNQSEKQKLIGAN